MTHPTVLRVSVGTDAVQLTETPLPNRQAILLSAVSDNSGRVFYGYSDQITTTSGSVEIPAGGFRVVSPRQADDASSLYLVASASGQDVRAEVLA